MAKTRRSVPDTTEGDEAQVGAKLGTNLTRETFEEHWRKIRTLKREFDEANGRYRAAKARGGARGQQGKQTDQPMHQLRLGAVGKAW